MATFAILCLLMDSASVHMADARRTWATSEKASQLMKEGPDEKGESKSLPAIPNSKESWNSRLNNYREEEEEFSKVARTNDIEAMKAFIRKVVAARKWLIMGLNQEADLNGFAPRCLEPHKMTLNDMLRKLADAKWVDTSEVVFMLHRRFSRGVFTPDEPGFKRHLRDEKEFRKVAQTKDIEAMKAFIRRVAAARKWRIINEGGLNEFAPWFLEPHGNTFNGMLQKLEQGKLGDAKWVDTSGIADATPINQPMNSEQI